VHYILLVLFIAFLLHYWVWVLFGILAFGAIAWGFHAAFGINILASPSKPERNRRTRVRRTVHIEVRSEPPSAPTQPTLRLHDTPTIALAASASRIPSSVPTRGLVIMAEPIEKILAGTKTLELRSKHNRQLGPVALIKKGSGQIYGVAEIVDSIGPMSFTDLQQRTGEHGVEPRRLREVFDKGWIYGWRLARVRRLPRPIPYVHRGMSQVNLDDAAIAELKRVLNGF